MIRTVDTVDVLAVIFVAVSVVTFTVQTVALVRLLSWPVISTVPGTLVHRGLLRTSMCRVVAGAAYVVLGLTIVVNQSSLPVLSLTVFTLVQLLWILNATADVRLRRALATLTSEDMA